jgi:hypothetical protein
MKDDDFVVSDIYLKLILLNQKPKQKEINVRRALTLRHIRSRENPQIIPFKVNDECFKIPTSSPKKLEFDLNYFKKIGEIIIKEAPYFCLSKNRTIPRNKFIFSTFKLEEDSLDELKNHYLDSLDLKKEKV